MPRIVPAVVAIACSAALAPTGSAETGRPAKARAVPPAEAASVPEPPEGATYAAWLRGLSRSERQRVDAFCREHPVEPEAACGGIGPLHIPVPPSEQWVKQGVTPSVSARADWRRGLTKAQRAYVDRYCASERWAFSRLCGATPLVVSFEDQPVRYAQTAGTFAFGPGDPVETDWPTADTPWLAIDLDGDGRITSGAELFGDHTALPGGAPARHGFDALAALDANGDGRIDRADPRFADLLLWADRDGDRRSAPDELSPAARVIESISLDYRRDARCDARLNCEGERAAVRWRDGARERAGSVVDVYLHLR